MARYEKQFVVQTGRAPHDRDNGKCFLLREMPAEQAEDWFCRAVALLARSGTDVPSDIFRHGPAAFVAMGIGSALSALGKAPWAEVKPLMAELLACVSFIPPMQGMPPITVYSQVMSQIEEVETILRLKEEVLSLHLGFSFAAKILELAAKAKTAMDQMLLQAMSMSGPSPEPSSAPE